MAKKKAPQVDWGPMGAFVLPKALMAHPDYRELSPSALKVLMVLGYQFNGRNNGNLSATHTMLQAWGGMAEATLCKALKELQKRELIIKTRTHYKGRDGSKPALFGLTWIPIHECPGKNLEIAPTVTGLRSLAVRDLPI